VSADGTKRARPAQAARGNLCASSIHSIHPRESMPPSDTQQSEAMPADTPPKPASSEASEPSTQDAPLSDVDDLLEQVQSLTQDIIEDATAEADAIDGDESVGGQSTVENDDIMVAAHTLFTSGKPTLN